MQPPVKERQTRSYLADGMPDKTAKGYDISACQAWLDARIAEKESTTADVTKSEAERLKVLEDVRYKRLRNDKMAGKLLPADQVYADVAQLVLLLSDRFDKIPEEISLGFAPEIRAGIKEQLQKDMDWNRTAMSQWNEDHFPPSAAP